MGPGELWAVAARLFAPAFRWFEGRTHRHTEAKRKLAPYRTELIDLIVQWRRDLSRQMQENQTAVPLSSVQSLFDGLAPYRDRFAEWGRGGDALNDLFESRAGLSSFMHKFDGRQTKNGDRSILWDQFILVDGGRQALNMTLTKAAAMLVELGHEEVR